MYLFLIMLFISVMSNAEIYKWVDVNGTMQYSTQKPMNAESTKVKLHSEPTSLKTSAELLQEKEQKRRLAIDKEVALKETSKETTENKEPKSLSDGREDGSNASRCNLAKDILNGALRHTNGKPIDAYDIRTAENDVRKFCD